MTRTEAAAAEQQQQQQIAPVLALTQYNIIGEVKQPGS